jgi:hypothetical protein
MCTSAGIIGGDASIGVGIEAYMLLDAVSLGSAGINMDDQDDDDDDDDTAYGDGTPAPRNPVEEDDDNDMLPLRSRVASSLAIAGDIFAHPAAGLSLVRGLIGCADAVGVIDTLLEMLPPALAHAGVTADLVADAIFAAELPREGLTLYEFTEVLALARDSCGGGGGVGPGVGVDSVGHCASRSQLHAAVFTLLRNADEIFVRVDGTVALAPRARSAALAWAGVASVSGGGGGSGGGGSGGGGGEDGARARRIHAAIAAHFAAYGYEDAGHTASNDGGVRARERVWAADDSWRIGLGDVLPGEGAQPPAATSSRAMHVLAERAHHMATSGDVEALYDTLRVEVDGHGAAAVCPAGVAVATVAFRELGRHWRAIARGLPETDHEAAAAQHVRQLEARDLAAREEAERRQREEEEGWCDG